MLPLPPARQFRWPRANCRCRRKESDASLPRRPPSSGRSGAGARAEPIRAPSRRCNAAAAAGAVLRLMTFVVDAVPVAASSQHRRPTRRARAKSAPQLASGRRLRRRRGRGTAGKRLRARARRPRRARPRRAPPPTRAAAALVGAAAAAVFAAGGRRVCAAWRSSSRAAVRFPLSVASSACSRGDGLDGGRRNAARRRRDLRVGRGHRHGVVRTAKLAIFCRRCACSRSPSPLVVGLVLTPRILDRRAEFSRRAAPRRRGGAAMTTCKSKTLRRGRADASRRRPSRVRARTRQRSGSVITKNRAASTRRRATRAGLVADVRLPGAGVEHVPHTASPPSPCRSSPPYDGSSTVVGQASPLPPARAARRSPPQRRRRRRSPAASVPRPSRRAPSSACAALGLRARGGQDAMAQDVRDHRRRRTGAPRRPSPALPGCAPRAWAERTAPSISRRARSAARIALRATRASAGRRSRSRSRCTSRC